MGKQFGNLKRLTGVTYYVLSPHELKPFKGVLVPGLQNTFRRFCESVLPVAGTIGLFYCVYSYAVNEHHRLNKKNPDDYKDDV